MPTERRVEIEFSDESGEAVFACPVPRLGSFVKFLDAEEVDVFKVESGMCPRTGEEIRFVFLDAEKPVHGSALVEKFRKFLG